ncbi:dTDP-4-dehydrorhamnose reductase [Shewanella aestuarii]|uniref:dTDP-4-dehydrorhamnose reductase n=1 Tax=Shewanella aestuarii TaxID=1028752 RepID=A0A6G9QLZ6_9GAMM|nr:dTDP-4-dehydrorhamnose reductase [Shewanella aestuarii]QIR15067.1 dTDP-4-dehydrorhamnose reductase [Shewanella aestuarii]
MTNKVVNPCSEPNTSSSRFYTSIKSNKTSKTVKVLLTGAAGAVGISIAQHLAEQVNLFSYTHEQLDITHADSVFTVIDKLKPDIIINAAGYTAVDNAQVDEAQARLVNCNGAKNLALAAERIDAILIHLSTDYVFSGESDSAYTEQDLPHPINVYGHSKLAGELAIQQHCAKHIIIRTAWVFAEHGHNFVKTIVELIKTHPVLTIVDDQIGGPTYAGDIAKVIGTVVDRITHTDFSADNYGVYHYCGMPYVSWKGFADSIILAAKQAELIAVSPKVNGTVSENYPRPAKRPKNSRLDCGKIQQIFNVSLSDWQTALTFVVGSNNKDLEPK